jgi:26S proteasome non-ATPase regulatory subunit 9
LRNDLKAVVDAIGKALERIYDPAFQQSSQINDSDSTSNDRQKPFAKVDGVAPGSPASEAVRILFQLYNIYASNETRNDQGLQRGDLVAKFGQLNESSFQSNSLQPLADLVAENENVSVSFDLFLTRTSNRTPAIYLNTSHSFR